MIWIVPLVVIVLAIIIALVAFFTGDDDYDPHYYG